MATDPLTHHIRAPFTQDQVWSLNAYQDSAPFHPYTCPNRTTHPDDGRRDRGILIATTLGWTCPHCTYTQTWAHQWTANWTWKNNQGSTP